MKQVTRWLVNKFGYDFVRLTDETSTIPPTEPEVPIIQTDDDLILRKVRPFTMTSDARILALVDSVRHLTKNGIIGSIVECGVWRGGSSMAAALTLLQEKDVSRDIYLFDTFTGMTEPSENDVSFDGVPAKDQFPNSGEAWCEAGMADVKANMESTSYPSTLLHYVPGLVEETITSSCPPHEIALLRLDTDWYESTRHELYHLFPRLVKGGILIIDDYGHWQGAKKAVDEYFFHHKPSHFMHRIDYTGRLIIKHA